MRYIKALLVSAGVGIVLWPEILIVVDFGCFLVQQKQCSFLNYGDGSIAGIGLLVVFSVIYSCLVLLLAVVAAGLFSMFASD